MEQKGAVLLTAKKLKEFFSGEKRVKLILAAGILGIALILLAPSPRSVKTQEAPVAEAFSGEAYAAKLEEKMLGLITNIEGVGNAQVLVTLENGVEYVYASQEKKNTDVTHDYSGEEVRKLHEKDNSESSYILVDGSSGKEALVRTWREPTVKGVVVVCEGGDDIDVQARVIQAVTTALDISSTQVCISRMARSG